MTLSISDKCDKCKTFFPIVVLLVNLGLFAFRVLIGIIGKSQSLLTSSLYSLTNIGSAITLIISLKISAKSPDFEHPYGHSKVEYIGITAIACFILIGIIYLIISTLGSLFRGVEFAPHWIVAAAALISIGINVIILRYATCVEKKYNSPSFIAQKEHIRGDMTGNMGVALAVVLANVGLKAADPIIAALEIIDLLILNKNLLTSAISGFMDTSIESHKVMQIDTVVKSVEGVEKVKKLRTCQRGEKVFVDVEINVNPAISIKEADRIAQKVKDSLQKKFRYVGDIRVNFV